jgi:type I restriction-modification system DNA methylase subunit
MLDMLRKGGTGVAIIPMNTVISPHAAKEDLLTKHTLKAVMTMPIELFYPVGAPTCIVVFEAHKPHKESNIKTWFGYWRNDGFEKTKHLGRIDLNDKWDSIKSRWIEQFKNKETKPGESVMAYVDHNDEWVAEAYLETDYSTISEDKFKDVVKQYSVFKMLNDK